MIPLNTIYNMDCLEGMKQLEDNSIDLVLTDPPYGINADKGIGGFGSSPNSARHYDDNWDDKSPDKQYFDEILRVGKRVVIFGGNYFLDKLPLNKKCWIVWDKIGNHKFNNPFSDVELAWTNFKGVVSKKYTIIQQGFIAEEKNRIHPTQKPVKLFRQIIKDNTVESDIVLDAFMGSGTTAVACKQSNRRFIGFEISKEYCDIANKRLTQESLFKPNQHTLIPDKTLDVSK